jgi:hypothetical protein
VYLYVEKSFFVWFGNSLMENLMAPFGFPLKGLFGSIFGGKMGGGNAPDVAAQKRPFGVRNGSTMPLDDRPLLCKKWSLIINNRYKNENRRKTAIWTVKVKKINKKTPTNRIDKPFFRTGTKSVRRSLSLRRKLFYS